MHNCAILQTGTAARDLGVQQPEREREMFTMRSTGIIRRLDKLGRIVLPIELRRILDIAENDELEIFMENDRIVLQKFESVCLFCGSSRKLIVHYGKNVCQNCVNKMSEY